MMLVSEDSDCEDAIVAVDNRKAMKMMFGQMNFIVFCRETFGFNFFFN